LGGEGEENNGDFKLLRGDIEMGGRSREWGGGKGVRAVYLGKKKKKWRGRKYNWKGEGRNNDYPTVQRSRGAHGSSNHCVRTTRRPRVQKNED